jgi:hypothetical protein
MAKRTGGFIGQDGINAPDPATGVEASGGDTSATVSWTAPSDVGGADITGYSVQSNNGDGTYVSSYDLSSASYDGVSFGVASQETAPYGLTFNNDGTKLYVTGQGTDTVFQYSLSTAFDLDTTSYDSVSFNANSQNTAIAGVAFNNDGTKMYLVGYNGPSSVFQYSLSTAFDLSTASYDSVTLNVSSQASTAFGLAFNNNGTKMYIVSFGDDTIYQYSLSSAFNLSTASYDSVSLYVNAQEAAPAGMTFNNDGTKMYIVGENGDEVNQYGLSTAFDLSTASYDNIAFSVSGQDIQPADIAFSNDGTKMYMVGYNTDAVYQYSTGIAAGEYPTSSPVTITGLTNGTSYTFNVWAINPFGWSSPSGASGSVAPSAPLGVMVGGGQTQNIQYINIASTGNASDWAGDTNTGTRQLTAGLSSATRGVYIGGNDTGVTSIEYITFASQGNAATFGTCGNNYGSAGMSNGTRGVWAANAYDPDDIEYVTIATTGNTATFGNIGRNNGCYYPSACNSTTRGVFKFGMNTSFTAVKYMDYITIATTGNSSTFGNTDQFATRSANGVACSETRGLFMGGNNSSNTGFLNFIEYLTIATTGDNTDFGDLTVSRGDQSAAVTSKTRAVCCGGYTGTRSNVMDYVEIASTGNATDFGDLTTGEQQWTGMSSSHGGLS